MRKYTNVEAVTIIYEAVAIIQERNNAILRVLIGQLEKLNKVRMF